MKSHCVDPKVTGRISAAKLSPMRRALLALLALGALIALAAASGCASAPPPRAHDADTIVGRPPSADEDPFFVRGTPANAERVQAQGRIEPVEAPEDVAPAQPAPEVVAPTQPAPEDVAPAQPEDVAPTPPTPEDLAEKSVPPPAPKARVEPRTEVAARGELNPTSKPEPAITEPVLPEEPAHAQCFSCVKICPVAGDCAHADEDIICGWGTQKDISQAKKLARAQCDATLDMARQMPIWSRIEGECPAATCR